MSFGRRQVQLTETTLERIARIYAENYGIRVVYKHDLCMTDGKVIYLPVIPEGASEEFLAACEGYVDHEVSHCLFTDFDVVKAAALTGKKHHLLLNAFEDPRVEREMMKLWRGTKINLANCKEWSLRQLKKHWEELSEFGKFVQACSLKPYQSDHWFVKEMIDADEQTMERYEKVQDLLEEAPRLKSTADCLELAKKVMERLAEPDEVEPQEEEGEEGEQGEESEEGTPQQSQGKPKKGKKRIKRSAEENEGEAFSNVSPEELEQDEEKLSPNKQIEEEAKQAQTSQRKRQLGKDTYLIYSTENDTIENITDGDKVACKRFLDDSRTITNALGRKFRLNLVSETKTRWDGGKRRGRLDKRRVSKIITSGDRNVFKARSIRRGFDTVALLLIDHSESMYPDSIDLAAKTALVFGENLQPLQVPFAIWGYSTGYFNEGRHIKSAASSAEQELYTRWGRLWIGVYKDFDENWQTTKHRCHHMSRNGKYNTYDGESVRTAALALMRRPEKRKLLFVLCDGYPCPNCHEYMDVHASYLKAVAREIETKIEVFAIGIGHNDVKKFYSNAVGIHALTDLPVVMLAELDRMLRKGQNAYARG